MDSEVYRIRNRYPDRIPVIVGQIKNSKLPEIDKKKYLVPMDLTLGQFAYVIRKRIQLTSEQALFIFIDNLLPPTSALMSSLYEQYKSPDGFLYVNYGAENTFGNK